MTADAPPKLRRNTRAAQSTPPRRAGFYLVGALAVVAPLALGGTRPDVQLALCGAALAALVFVSYTRLGRKMHLPWPLWGPALLVGLGLLQLVPLPTELLAALSPTAHTLREASLADLGLFDAPQPLSLDAPATWLATLHQAAFVAMALMALDAAPRHRARLARVLAGGAALVAALGIVHWVAGADRVLFTWAPRDLARLEGYFSTFINNNTLAGYLTLGALVSAGLLAGAQTPERQRFAGLCLALCATGVVASGSRGGQVALLAGFAMFGALAFARSDAPDDPRRRRARQVAVAVGALVLLGVGAAFWLQPEWHGAWTAPGADRKVTAWWSMGPYLGDFAAVGSGRGTFAYVYPLYQELHISGSLSHPENILVQLGAEWGLVGAAVALGFGVLGWIWAVRNLGRGARPRPWGLAAGVGAVGLHQLVDFGLEAPGLSFPTAVAFGLLLASGRGAHKLKRRAPAPTLLLVALALGLLAAWKGPAAVAQQADAAVADLARGEDDPVATARAHVRRHPADHLVALAAAQRIAADDPAAALRWINRALRLFPEGARGHHLAARTLVRLGRPAQAVVEYRLALEKAPWQRRALLREAADLLRSPAHLAALSSDPALRRLLGNLLLEADRPRALKAMVEHLAFTEPDAPELRELYARACLAQRDHACADEAARWLVDRGHVRTGEVLRAAAAAQRGDAAAAHAALEVARSTVDAPGPDLLRASVQVHLRLGDVQAARADLDALWRMSPDDAAAAASLALSAQVEEKIGDPKRALRAWRRALRLNPRVQFARGAVRVARRLGDDALADRLLAEALRRWPEVPSARIDATGGGQYDAPPPDPR